MIARIGRRRAPLATAGDYQRHYETEVSGHLRAVSGAWTPSAALPETISNWPSSRNPRGKR